jgi:hypothetical protein
MFLYACAAAAGIVCHQAVAGTINFAVVTMFDKL